MPFIRAQSVTAPIRARYEEACLKFDEWSWNNGHEVSTPDQLDAALDLWMTENYVDAKESWEGSHMLAALEWHDPRYGRQGDLRLPLAHQALKGWRRLAPGHSRLPLPAQVVAMLAMRFAVIGRRDMAVCIMAMMSCYLRPAEPFRLKVASVVPPVPAAGMLHARWSITMHEFVGEGSRPSKTGEFDESLQLDLSNIEWVGRCLGNLPAPQALGFALRVHPTRAVRRVPPGRDLPQAQPAPRAVPDPARGRQQRLQRGPPQSERDQAARPLEDRRLRPEVREGRPGDGAIARAAPQRAAPRDRVPRPNPRRALGAAATPSIPALLSVRVFLEVIAGTARLASAMAKRGYHILAWDIRYGEGYDLKSLKNRQLIRGWILGPRIIALHFGTPCNSWSRVRDFGPGPPRFRSDEHVMGLLDFRP